MYYFDYVRARGSLTVYAWILAGFVVFILASIPFSHAGHGDTTIGINGEAIRLRDFHGYGLLHELGQKIEIPFTILCAIASSISAIYATTFATSLSRVNANLHLWFTRPVSRERTAVVTIAVDAIAIAIGFVLTLAALLLPIAATGLLDRLRFEGSAWIAIGGGLSVAYMWYAMVQAATAGLRTKAGIVLGLSWPVFLTLRSLEHAGLGFLPDFVTWTIHVLNYLNPFTYLGAVWVLSDPKHGSHATADPAEFAILWLTIAVSLGIAIAVRRRMEA